MNDSVVRFPCSKTGEAGLGELRQFFAARMGGRHAMTMPERRASFAGLMTSFFPDIRSAQISAGQLGARPCETSSPLAGAPIADILYFHGGAYVSGGLATHRHFCAVLAMAGQTQVYSLDYRLAPEHPHPAAVEDAIAAYLELRSRSNGSRPLFVGGDSAGGGLTLALSLSLRDSGARLPEGLLLLSPFVDLTMSSDSYSRLADADPFLTKAGLALDVARYAPDAASRRGPLLSPLFADLRGLPPTILQTGTDEILLDEILALVGKLREAGVPVEAQLWERMVHNWHLFGMWLPEADQATRELGAFVRRAANERP